MANTENAENMVNWVYNFSESESFFHWKFPPFYDIELPVEIIIIFLPVEMPVENSTDDNMDENPNMIIFF